MIDAVALLGPLAIDDGWSLITMDVDTVGPRHRWLPIPLRRALDTPRNVGRARYSARDRLLPLYLNTMIPITKPLIGAIAHTWCACVSFALRLGGRVFPSNPFIGGPVDHQRQCLNNAGAETGTA